ncbi:MAG: hypothetical protein R6U52_01895, partial [Kosmotogaceae bacterium]
MNDILTITQEYKGTETNDHKETLDLAMDAIMDITLLASPLLFESYSKYLEEKNKKIDNYDDIIPNALPYFYMNVLEEYMAKQLKLNANFLTQILSNELTKPSDDPEYLKIKIYYYPYNYQGQLYEAYKFDNFSELI